MWHSKDSTEKGLIWRVENRHNEMQERRRRLLKYMYKKEGRLDEFPDKYKENIQKKT